MTHPDDVLARLRADIARYQAQYDMVKNGGSSELVHTLSQHLVHLRTQEAELMGTPGAVPFRPPVAPTPQGYHDPRTTGAMPSVPGHGPGYGPGYAPPSGAHTGQFPAPGGGYAPPGPGPFTGTQPGYGPPTGQTGYGHPGYGPPIGYGQPGPAQTPVHPGYPIPHGELTMVMSAQPGHPSGLINQPPLGVKPPKERRRDRNRQAAAIGPPRSSSRRRQSAGAVVTQGGTIVPARVKPTPGRRVVRWLIGIMVLVLIGALLWRFSTPTTPGGSGAQGGSSATAITGLPANLDKVKAEVDQACQDSNVKSAPAGINFACDSQTRKVLWVFALMTNPRLDPSYKSPTGRLGLEPILPNQGQSVATSMNITYNADNPDPVVSIKVLARAINSYLGGYGTTIGPLITHANCGFYTGHQEFAAARVGYPTLCANPITPGGAQQVVYDLFKLWAPKAPGLAAVPGKPAADGQPAVAAQPAQPDFAARSAVTVFDNPDNPSKIEPILAWVQQQKNIV